MIDNSKYINIAQIIVASLIVIILLLILIFLLILNGKPRKAIEDFDVKNIENGNLSINEESEDSIDVSSVMKLDIQSNIPLKRENDFPEVDLELNSNQVLIKELRRLKIEDLNDFLKSNMEVFITDITFDNKKQIWNFEIEDKKNHINKIPYSIFGWRAFGYKDRDTNIKDDLLDIEKIDNFVAEIIIIEDLKDIKNNDKLIYKTEQIQKDIIGFMELILLGKVLTNDQMSKFCKILNLREPEKISTSKKTLDVQSISSEESFHSVSKLSSDESFYDALEDVSTPENDVNLSSIYGSYTEKKKKK